MTKKTQAWFAMNTNMLSADLRLMTTMERGIYISLVQRCIENGGVVENNERVLRVICGVTNKHLSTVEQVLQNYFIKIQNNSGFTCKIIEFGMEVSGAKSALIQPNSEPTPSISETPLAKNPLKSMVLIPIKKEINKEINTDRQKEINKEIKKETVTADNCFDCYEIPAVTAAEEPINITTTSVGISAVTEQQQVFKKEVIPSWKTGLQQVVTGIYKDVDTSGTSVLSSKALELYNMYERPAAAAVPVVDLTTYYPSYSAASVGRSAAGLPAGTDILFTADKGYYYLS